MGCLSNPQSCGYGGSTLSWSKINLISSACLLTAKKNKSKQSWNFARVVIVSVTYLMYIPRITMVGEDAVDTTSMM